MPWRIVARSWLERLEEALTPTFEDDDALGFDPDDPGRDANRAWPYDPPRCGECGESRMVRPRATVCCGEVLCATCAREAIEAWHGTPEGFVCPFCGAALGASWRRIIDQARQQFGEEGYLELLGIYPDDRDPDNRYGRRRHRLFH